MPRKRRVSLSTVSIPSSLLDDVRSVVDNPESFYTSLADLVKEALREKLERIQSTRNIKTQPDKPPTS